MLPEDDRVRIRHMLEAAEEVLEFAEGRSRGDLDTDRMLSRAMVRDIEIIGEAASRVTSATRQICPELPWSSIIAMRNKLIHAYFDVDNDRLWDTIVVDIPMLLPALRNILESG